MDELLATMSSLLEECSHLNYRPCLLPHSVQTPMMSPSSPSPSSSTSCIMHSWTEEPHLDSLTRLAILRDKYVTLSIQVNEKLQKKQEKKTCDQEKAKMKQACQEKMVQLRNEIEVGNKAVVKCIMQYEHVHKYTKVGPMIKKASLEISQ